MNIRLFTLRAMGVLQISFLIGCNSPRSSETSNPDEKVLTGTPALIVQDLGGRPIPNAQILIGDAVGQPFPKNQFTTDSNGSIALPKDWKESATVSVSARGFVTASFLHMTVSAHTMKLRNQINSSKVEYTGKTSGYAPFNDTSTAHVSLVFEALKRSELGSFSLSNIVSPESDSFSVLGNTVSVPSNLAIPDQTLSYFFHFKVSKPQFRIPLTTSADHLMVGLHAQFPVTELIKSVRNKDSIYNMINFFNFSSFSQQITGVGSTDLNEDLDISKTQFSLKNHVQAQNFDSSLILLAISSVQQNDTLIPLDVKSMNSGASVDLNTLSPQHLSEKTISVLRLNNFDSQEQMSISIQDATQSSLPDQLPLISSPSIVGSSLDQVLPSSQPSHIKAQGMYYSLSAIEAEVISNVTIETKSTLWDVYNPNWETSTQLPTLPAIMKNAGPAGTVTSRWNLSLMGQDSTIQSELGPDRLTTINYLSRSAVDFK